MILRTDVVATTLVLSLSALLSACGGGSQESRFGGRASREQVVTAPGDPAQRYETSSSTEAVVAGAEAAAVKRGILHAARDHHMEMRGDGRLGLLAAWVAERLGPAGEPPQNEVVEFFARHVGIVEPVPHLIVLGQPDRNQLEQSVAESVSQFLNRLPYNRYGATVVPRQGFTIAVIALSLRQLEIEPIPRRVEPGHAISLRGRLMGPLTNPSFAVAKPSGEVLRLPAGSGPTFDVRIPTEEEGIYRVELLARGDRGDTVVANFPVYVGVPIPESITIARAESGGSSRDVESVRRELFRMLNDSRRSPGTACASARRGGNALPVLEHHDGLAKVALAHSRDMVEHNFVGHTSPTTGGATDRVERAGYHSGLVLENIGRGYSPTEIHRGLLQSPGHCANIVNPDVTHVGVGVVAEDEGTRTAYVATEVFIRMAREIELRSAPDRVLELLNRARRARGASELETDPNLTRAAVEGARDFFRDRQLSQQDVVDQSSSSLRRFSIAFRRIAGVMAVVTTLDEAGQLEPVLDPEIRFIGVGVSQGTRPDTGPNAIAVVIMLAWPR